MFSKYNSPRVLYFDSPFFRNLITLCSYSIISSFCNGSGVPVHGETEFCETPLAGNRPITNGVVLQSSRFGVPATYVSTVKLNGNGDLQNFTNAS
jgi:hypothetical protein